MREMSLERKARLAEATANSESNWLEMSEWMSEPPFVISKNISCLIFTIKNYNSTRNTNWV